MLVVDYFSKFPELVSLKKASTDKYVINALKSIFSRFGIPKTLVTDNGSPFNSESFSNFLDSWDIDHFTSSPRYPRSNGMVERTIQTIKNLMRKCLDSGEDFHLALLNFRNTPKTDAPSPCELIMSRNLRTKLPTSEEQLKPKTIDLKEYAQTLKKRSQSMIKSSSSFKRLTPLNNLDGIFFKKTPDDHWVPGTIIGKCKEPDLYLIQSANGKVYRRTRYHLKAHNKNVRFSFENLDD